MPSVPGTAGEPRPLTLPQAQTLQALVESREPRSKVSRNLATRPPPA